MRTVLGLKVLGAATVVAFALGCGDSETTSTGATSNGGNGGNTTSNMGGGGMGMGGMTNNTDPVASFTMTPTCTMSSMDPVTFTSTSTDADGDALTCSWTFASGTPATSMECTATGVVFPSVAPYMVTLIVDDGTTNNSTTMSIAPCP